MKLFKIYVNIFFLLAFVLMNGCMTISNSDYSNWENLAHNSNLYIKNHCKADSNICNKNYKDAITFINDDAFRKYRKKIINRLLKVEGGNFLIVETMGSGETFYFDIHVYEINNYLCGLKYSYDFTRKKGLKWDLVKPINKDVLNFINQLDYVKLNDSLEWKLRWTQMGLNYNSYTSIKNNKLVFVKFISDPIIEANFNSR